MTAPAPERPALSVVPAPQPAVDAVPIQAARIALGEMLDSLGVTTRPAQAVTTDSLLTLLLQASGAHVTVPQAVADHAAWLGAVAGCKTTEVAS